MFAPRVQVRQGLTTTVPELANAYQAIANGGLKLPLRLVESCTAADGTVTTPENGEPMQVISPEAARQVTDMLENVATKGSVSEKVGIAPRTASPAPRNLDSSRPATTLAASNVVL